MDLEEAEKRLKNIDIKFFLSARVEHSNYIVSKADEINTAIEIVLKELEELKADNYECNNIINEQIDLLNNSVSKDVIREKIDEYSNTKGDFATYIAVSERIKALQELL